jgi:hypothetical protein
MDKAGSVFVREAGRRRTVKRGTLPGSGDAGIAGAAFLADRLAVVEEVTARLADWSEAVLRRLEPALEPVVAEGVERGRGDAPAKTLVDDFFGLIKSVSS